VAGDFGDRIDELKERVGSGDLTGSVAVDQVYAAVQHNHLDWNHPRGGQALYLQQPLLDHKDDYLQRIADGVLDDGGKAAMREAVEDLAEGGGVASHAPVEFGDLRDSGHPSVTEDGATVYDREPRQHRLSEDELKAKYRLHHPHVSTLSAKERAFLYASGLIGREDV
jgi:hypothetical protein